MKNNRKHIKTFENHSTNVNTNINSFEIGDLVFDKTAGNSGLVGLVVGKPTAEELSFDDEFGNEYTQKVLFRGYGGDIIDTEINDLVDIIDDEQLMELAEKKGDLSSYKSIAKKSNITLNPKYDI